MRLRRVGALALSCVASVASAQDSVRFTYLGAAGWEITDGKTVVLIDPYLTRLKDNTPNDRPAPEDTRPQINQGTVVASDTAVVDKHIKRADFILITHGHPDHTLDMAYIARKTGATVIGTESTGNLARALGVPERQVKPVATHDSLKFDGISVVVVPSRHGVFAKPADATAPPPAPRLFPATARPPFTINYYVEGGTLAYLLRMGGHDILIFGSMNYIESALVGLRPDIALIGAMPERANIDGYTPRLMRALGNPPIVFPAHWDRFNTPYELGQPQAALDRVNAFATEVKAASPTTRVIIPEHLKPVSIGPRGR
jgi:L-ascorbate metabolism protein UlaG (beta-lactamase superfamily)